MDKDEYARQKTGELLQDMRTEGFGLIDSMEIIGNIHRRVLNNAITNMYLQGVDKKTAQNIANAVIESSYILMLTEAHQDMFDKLFDMPKEEFVQRFHELKETLPQYGDTIDEDLAEIMKVLKGNK